MVFVYLDDKSNAPGERPTLVKIAEFIDRTIPGNFETQSVDCAHTLRSAVNIILWVTSARETDLWFWDAAKIWVMPNKRHNSWNILDVQAGPKSVFIQIGTP